MILFKNPQKICKPLIFKKKNYQPLNHSLRSVNLFTLILKITFVKQFNQKIKKLRLRWKKLKLKKAIMMMTVP